MTGPMREVELVDEVDVRVPTAPAPVTAPSWPRRNARWLVLTAALAVLALVGTQALLDARERSRIAALAEIPGVLPPTGPDIGVIWRAPPRLGTVLQGGSLVDGLLVGGATDESGSIRVVALDPDTGVTRWATPVALPTARPQADGVARHAWVSCREVPHDGRPLAACVSQEYGDNVLGPPDSTIVVLDPSDGHVLSTRTVTGTSGVTVTQDAVVVASRVDETGAPARFDAESVRWDVTATDALNGVRLWTYVTPPVDVVRWDDVPAATDASGGATLQTFGDQVVLSVDTDAWILGDDGTLVRRVPLENGSWIQAARAGAYVLSSYTTADRYTARLLLADGTQVPIDQTAAWLPVDDGSAPEVVITVGDGPSGGPGITGRDATTGAVLWERADPVTATLLLDSVVYVAAADRISAVDARTGAVRWTTTLDHQPRQLSTDGRYLLVPGTRISLAAYSLADGRRAWSVDLFDAVTQRSPTQIAQGFQSGPRLVVWMTDGAVAVLG